MPVLPRRDIHGHFDSASDAYEFAVTILQLRRGGKALNYDPDRVGQTNSHGEYAQLDAICILGAIERNDVHNGRISWFADYFMPIPTVEPIPFTDHQVSRLTRHVRKFECDIARLGFLAHCGKGRCRKKLTRQQR